MYHPFWRTVVRRGLLLWIPCWLGEDTLGRQKMHCTDRSHDLEIPRLSVGHLSIPKVSSERATALRTRMGGAAILLCV